LKEILQEGAQNRAELKSEEIRNIITVLGTGVGKEEYDINNVKYHKVIIMTDADVDGSHIRTLLLTFFYRQMPELVDKGYLYIAQPPLFKVGKGKSAVYLKDEVEYSDYILQRACNNKNIFIEKTNKTISDKELYLFLVDLSEYLINIKKLEQRGFDYVLIELLINNGVDDKKFLQNKEKMMSLIEALKEKKYDVKELLWNDDRDTYELNILTKIKKNGNGKNEEKQVQIGPDLIFSTNYQKCLIIGRKILHSNNPPFLVRENNKTDSVLVEDSRKLLSLLLENGKKGLSVQRYKGLGEMNPDQLWETTMNPDARTLLQIKVEDAVEADEIFTILMGEEVEPRRDFIQNNALSVSTLDI